MKKVGQEKSLEEIRKAQAEIALQMSKTDLSRTDMLNIEKASRQLRELERMLTASLEKELLATLKTEVASLKALTEEMHQTSERLFSLISILRKIIAVADQVIEILAL